ncbi:putative lipase [Operophtera brumata]|uniref:Putative lipase n=1 Tax=Operophtera brumata TaxID=104452 RepID=A0A0L7L8R4_OPEBR|nr:putative lipase [Operophtera brumata]
MFNTIKHAALALIVPSSTAQPKVDEINGKKLDATHELLNMAGKAIITKIADAKQPLDQSIMRIGCSQSAELKKLMGLDYEQVQKKAEPNLDQLTLSFISDELRSSFKLGSVAETLPKAPGYNIKQTLVIFMHGFTDDPNQFNFAAVNEAFHSKGHCNILALDASPLIRYLYLRSSTYVRFIGEKLGATLAKIVESGQDHKNIHLVGHSLGAHIAGFAGKTFHLLTGTLVGRISGLDPAGPCFTHVDSNLRLAASDAEFVDVIHTNAGVYGLTSPVGHVDFFPNGGAQQPNCLFEFMSHSRVVELFAESVKNPESFPARACKDWEEFKREESSGDVSLMGYGCKPGTKGLYYLRTGDEKPYGLSQKGLLFESEGVMKTAKHITQCLYNILD